MKQVKQWLLGRMSRVVFKKGRRQIDKLNPDDVRFIRTFWAGRCPPRDIAEAFGVEEQTILEVLRGESRSK
jgi:hypothetical protein